MNIKNLKEISPSLNNFNVKIIDIDFYNTTNRRIFLGHVGDHNLYVLRVIIPKDESWNDSHSVILSFQSKNDNEAKWISNPIIDGDSYYFLVNNLITATAGEGLLQFHIFFPDIENNTKNIIAKSSKISYIIGESLSLENSEAVIPTTQLTIIEELISNYNNIVNSKENISNKVMNISNTIDVQDNTNYPSVSAVRDWVNSTFAEAEKADYSRDVIIGTKLSGTRSTSSTEAVLTTGYLFDFSTKADFASNTGRYYRLNNISSGDIFLCSGRTMGSAKYAFYGFLDSNGDVIMTYAPVLNTTYTDVEIIAPKGAASLIVNGTSSYMPSIRAVEYDTDVLSDLSKDVDDLNTESVRLGNAKLDAPAFDNYEYEAETMINQGFMDVRTGAIYAGTTSRSYEYSVSPGDVMVCHGRTSVNGAVYPAFIFLDSDRNVIGSSGSANSTTHTETLTVPRSCATLVINGMTSAASYVPYCYKRIYAADKPFNLPMARNLRNIAALNPFEFSSSQFGEHGTVTFVFDDGHEDLDSICSIFEEFNYPVCLAVPPERLKARCTELTEARGSFTVGMTVKEVCDAVVANGGEIMVHHFTPVSAASQYDYDFMLTNYYTGRLALENAGYTVRGFIKAGGTGSVTRTDELEAWLNGNYEYSDSGKQLNFNLTRISINQPLADLQALIQGCAENRTWLRFMGHYYTTGGGQTFAGESDLRTILGYCRDAGVEVATYATVFDRYKN